MASLCGSPEDSIRLRLRGLDPAASYVVTDLGENKPRTVGGKDLAEQGLAVEIKAKPGAAVFVYARTK
ncbi:MAG: GH36 C-terminal domain-containing protein [Phycisphaerae bacterium]|nr:GH36 C-terminal domain-containing protein [Phycisphaerae bacterium]